MVSSVDNKQVDRLLDIKEDNPYLFWRIIAIRNMIEHRNFTVKYDIAPAMGRSYENVYAALRGAQYRFSDEDPNVHRNNTYSTEAIHRTLDRIEEVITTLTEERGSLYGICGCTPGAIAEIKDYLGSSLDVRRNFNERTDYDTD